MAENFPMTPIRTILHPTDFSDCSRWAFRLAACLAQAEGARLVVLHVKQAPPSSGLARRVLNQLPPGEYDDWLRHQLERFRVANSVLQVEHRLTEGNPASEILRVVRDTDCDLVVMGTHGRTGLDQLVLGSVAEWVAKKAQCPVVTVRTPELNPAGILRSRAAYATMEACPLP
jgi:nucleotide-binding universal stress UspA family protein